MGRVIKYWIVLGTVAAVTTYGGVLLVFEHIDLSFLQFATLVCAPLLQAVVLGWRAERPADAIAAVARSVFQQPFAQPVIVIDALMIGGGIVWWYSHVVGFGAEINVQSTWTLVKALAATAFVVSAVMRREMHHRTSLARQMIAPVLLVFALDPSTSWLAAGFDVAHPRLGDQGEVVQRLVFYGVLFSLLIGFTLRSSRQLSRWSSEAGRLLQLTVAASVALAVSVVLATFNLPTLVQPWLGMAAASASVASTSVLLASIFLATARAQRAAPPEI